MALRIPWDIEEAVLMLDMLLKSLDGKLTRKEAIRQVSEKLRRRAVNRGIEIDDIFRNENGGFRGWIPIVTIANILLNRQRHLLSFGNEYTLIPTSNICATVGYG